MLDVRRCSTTQPSRSPPSTPRRARVLAALARPGSATTIAAALGETRRVNHHVRPRGPPAWSAGGGAPAGNLTERIVISVRPLVRRVAGALGPVAVDPTGSIGGPVALP